MVVDAIHAIFPVMWLGIVPTLVRCRLCVVAAEVVDVVAMEDTEEVALSATIGRLSAISAGARITMLATARPQPSSAIRAGDW